MRAQERYQDSKGDFYAAGITYFTVFAIFPLLMVGIRDRRIRARRASPICWPNIDGAHQVDGVRRPRSAAGQC